MLDGFDADTLRFAEPLYLWMLLLPAALLLLWIWQLARRWLTVRAYRQSRTIPVRDALVSACPLTFWLGILAASIFCILGLARPQARAVVLRTAGADLVILQDGSASMYVTDVEPDRWQRSVQFIRNLGESLSWQGDRVALALFAQLASPQVRLTSDPDALFFFIDHLGTHSPFRLEDNPTWDTNIEKGIEWGIKLIEKDQELFGKSANPKAFVVISDGQAWTGEVAAALTVARARDIPVHVVGVGTTQGGLIPEPLGPDGTRPPPIIRARLDRDSLRNIARAGGGNYFELGSTADHEIVVRILTSVKRRAETRREEETVQELYWYCLLAAGIALCATTTALRGRPQLRLQAAAAVAAIAVLVSLAY